MATAVTRPIQCKGENAPRAGTWSAAAVLGLRQQFGGLGNRRWRGRQDATEAYARTIDGVVAIDAAGLPSSSGMTPRRLKRGTRWPPADTRPCKWFGSRQSRLVFRLMLPGPLAEAVR